MAITKEYEANKVKNRKVEARGTISIAEIDPKLVKKYNIRVGELTPWSRLRVTE